MENVNGMERIWIRKGNGNKLLPLIVVWYLSGMETIESIMIEEGNVICFHQFDKDNKWGDYVSLWKRYLLLNTHTKQLEMKTLI